MSLSTDANGFIILNANDSRSIDAKIASQLGDLLVAQRVYKANSQILTSSENLLKSLDQMM